MYTRGSRENLKSIVKYYIMFVRVHLRFKTIYISSKSIQVFIRTLLLFLLLWRGLLRVFCRRLCFELEPERHYIIIICTSVYVLHAKTFVGHNFFFYALQKLSCARARSWERNRNNDPSVDHGQCQTCKKKAIAMYSGRGNREPHTFIYPSKKYRTKNHCPVGILYILYRYNESVHRVSIHTLDFGQYLTTFPVKI